MKTYMNVRIENFTRYHKKTPESLCILHICNCVACKPHGLSLTISKCFPYAKVYEKRTAQSGFRNLADIQSRPEPGSISVNSAPSQPTIVSCFAQFKMGRSNSQYFQRRDRLLDQHYKTWHRLDTKEWRKKMFAECLDNVVFWIEENGGIETIAIPYKVGCGLAGGNWVQYERIISDKLLRFCKEKKIDLILICPFIF